MKTVARLNRQELYEMVWTEPIRSLAARLGTSDASVKSACVRASIPTPERGFWAQKEAGKTVRMPTLPLRAPGMDQIVTVGGSQHWYEPWTREELLGPLPPPPEFDESCDALRKRIAKGIGQVTVPRSVRNWHPSLARLLAADEKRKQKRAESEYAFLWDAPIFEAPAGRRRLRILNSLFVAVAKMHGRPEIRGKEGREVSLLFHGRAVSVSLDDAKAKAGRGQSDIDPKRDRLQFSIPGVPGSPKMRWSWTDENDSTLEDHIADIAVSAILAAELQYREHAISNYQHRVSRKAEIEEEDRKNRAEAERKERERQERLAQARIDRLLADATAFRQANDIRRYVATMAERTSRTQGDTTEAFRRWQTWALAQADQIDPSRAEKFLRSMDDTGSD